MSRNASRSGKNVTIHEVAAAAGISYGTVSRVINNAPYVKPETRQRVHEAMERLGYTVDRRARSLAGGRSHVLAVLVPDLGTGYIGEIIRGIDAEVELAQYDLMLYTTHREAAKESSYVASIARGLADGLLLVLPSDLEGMVSRLRQIEFPFVLVDYQGVEENVPAVGATNWQGAYNATEYLIGLGHRRIGFITGNMEMAAARQRLEGYQAGASHPPPARRPRVGSERRVPHPRGVRGRAGLAGAARSADRHRSPPTTTWRWPQSTRCARRGCACPKTCPSSALTASLRPPRSTHR